ncbi:hypothetical protein KP78_26750 [Jeotgalibacillus soli]|uniref:Uncharacterized protein n=1 Tax=Jeotgalibacillus soli TaxID=889306 RepID=A0A0C2VL06_9BACL|nr:hypothetical protein KP78_26750 [Jeotgalibacillus soli]
MLIILFSFLAMIGYSAMDDEVNQALSKADFFLLRMASYYDNKGGCH